MKIAIIGCSKRKLQKECRAEELYSSSALFRYSLLYCKRNYDKVYILSARYGVITLDTIVKSYNLMITQMGFEEKVIWGRSVSDKLNSLLDKDDVVIFHCGKEYYKWLNVKCKYKVFSHLPIGKRLQFYRRCLKMQGKKLTPEEYSEDRKKAMEEVGTDLLDTEKVSVKSSKIVKCTVCGAEKFCSNDRYLKLEATNRIPTYICRNCRKNGKEKDKNTTEEKVSSVV